MVGGDTKILDRCKPVLEAVGKSIVHVGPNGMGQTVKLMNQILVAGNLNATVEALMFGKKHGVDLDTAIQAIKGGAAGSWQLSNLAPRILKRDFRPGFKVSLIESRHRGSRSSESAASGHFSDPPIVQLSADRL
jgi:3-hydroxyisobutyrate dehydrogenase